MIDHDLVAGTVTGCIEVTAGWDFETDDEDGFHGWKILGTRTDDKLHTIYDPEHGIWLFLKNFPGAARKGSVHDELGRFLAPNAANGNVGDTTIGGDEGETWTFESLGGPVGTGGVDLIGVAGSAGAELSDIPAQSLGAASAGNSIEASRADHVHQQPTPAQIGAAEEGGNIDGSQIQSGFVPDIHIPATIARDSEVTSAISTHAGATDPHGDRAYADTSKLGKASNLSDLASAATARTNLGLGTAATAASSSFATAAQGTAADTALQPLYALLASDFSVADSSTTLADVTGLGIAVVTGHTYIGEAILFVTAGTSACDIAVSLTAPTGTLRAAVTGVQTAETATIGVVRTLGIITVSGGSVSAGVVTGGTQTITVKWSFVATGTGTLQVRAAQATSTGAAALKVLTGSYIEARRMA